MDWPAHKRQASRRVQTLDALPANRMSRNADPKLLRLPLVRGGKLLSIGHDEDSWKAMFASA